LAKQGQANFIGWASPTLNDLYSAFMVNSSEGWFVGGGVTIIHWNGTQWANFTSPTNATLFSVSMVGSDDGWAVGAFERTMDGVKNSLDAGLDNCIATVLHRDNVNELNKLIGLSKQKRKSKTENRI
jgi:hypothetical protein